LDKRIKELTDAKKEAEKQAFDAEMAKIKAEQVAADLRAAQNPETKQVSAPPDPKDFIYGDVDPDYTNAMIAHGVEVEVAKRQSTAETATSQASIDQENMAYAAKVQTTMTAGTKKFKDFEKVVNGAQFDAHLARLVVDSEKPVDIAYYLANNVSELLQITRAEPTTRARLIGKLEGKLSVTSTGRKKKTNAPKPLKGSKASSAKSSGKYGPSDQDAFDKALLG